MPRCRPAAEAVVEAQGGAQSVSRGASKQSTGLDYGCVYRKTSRFTGPVPTLANPKSGDPTLTMG